MRLIGLARLGKDFELRFSPEGAPVGTVVCAWGYGKRDAHGKQTPQWCELALWGDRAEKLAPYLLKGQQVYVIATDVRVETFAKSDGSQGHRMVGRVDTIEFGAKPSGAATQDGARPAPSQSAASQQSSSKPARPALPAPDSKFHDDDIPF